LSRHSEKVAAISTQVSPTSRLPAYVPLSYRGSGHRYSAAFSQE